MYIFKKIIISILISLLLTSNAYGARFFTIASSQYLNNANAVVTGYPATFACWFNSNNQGEQYLLTVGDTATNDREIALGIDGGTANDSVDAAERTPATTYHAYTSTGYTENTWHHVIAIFAGATDRRSYIDNGSEGSNTTSAGPLGLDTTRIGSKTRNTAGDYFGGAIAECAIWDVALSAVDRAILAAGYSPLFVQRQNLIAYWPLLNHDNDIVNGYNMTPINSPTWASDHPPMIYPASAHIITAPTAAEAAPAPIPPKLMIMGRLIKNLLGVEE